ncbi:retrovirus-related pol polyprotein from transposon TNT 1-94 [Tanacetum coccineum]
MNKCMKQLSPQVHKVEEEDIYLMNPTLKEANYAGFEEREEIMLMVLNLDQGFVNSVKLRNNSRMNVSGKEKPSEYWFTPAKGSVILFQNDICKVFHQDKGLVFQSYMSMNRMYPLCEEIKELLEQSTESSFIWGDYTPIDGDTFEVFDDEEEPQQPPADNDNVGDQPNEAVIQDVGPSNTTAREGRVRRPPRYLDDYAIGEEVILSDEEQLNVMEVIDQDPIRYDKVIKHKKWVKAMDQEIQSIEKNETWQIVDLPEDVKCIGVKWVFKTKLNERREVKKHKARLVARGYGQEHGVDYLEQPEGKFLFVNVYVDDLLYTGNDRELLEDFKESMKAEYEMSDMGKMSCNVVVNPIVPRCKLRREEGESVDETLFKQLVGNYGIWYKRDGEGNMKVFTDSDYAGNFDDMKTVTWSSKKQSIMALSSTKAEYVAADACACQVIWVRGVLQELSLKMEEKTVINCDNTSVIKLSRNPVFHGRCKHIGVRFHFLRDLVSDGVIELQHCGTKEQVVDIFTKPLHREVLLKLRD